MIDEMGNVYPNLGLNLEGRDHVETEVEIGV